MAVSTWLQLPVIYSISSNSTQVKTHPAWLSPVTPGKSRVSLGVNKTTLLSHVELTASSSPTESVWKIVAWNSSTTTVPKNRELRVSVTPQSPSPKTTPFTPSDPSVTEVKESSDKLNYIKTTTTTADNLPTTTALKSVSLPPAESSSAAPKTRTSPLAASSVTSSPISNICKNSKPMISMGYKNSQSHLTISTSSLPVKMELSWSLKSEINKPALINSEKFCPFRMRSSSTKPTWTLLKQKLII